MATTAKIAKDRKRAEANKLAYEQKKKPKFKCRHRNRCWRCGLPAPFCANTEFADSASGNLP